MVCTCAPTGALREGSTSGLVEYLLEEPSRALNSFLYRLEYLSMSLIFIYGLFLNALLPISWSLKAYRILIVLSFPGIFCSSRMWRFSRASCRTGMYS